MSVEGQELHDDAVNDLDIDDYFSNESQNPVELTQIIPKEKTIYKKLIAATKRHIGEHPHFVSLPYNRDRYPAMRLGTNILPFVPSDEDPEVAATLLTMLGDTMYPGFSDNVLKPYMNSDTAQEVRDITTTGGSVIFAGEHANPVEGIIPLGADHIHKLLTAPYKSTTFRTIVSKGLSVYGLGPGISDPEYSAKWPQAALSKVQHVSQVGLTYPDAASISRMRVRKDVQTAANTMVSTSTSGKLGEGNFVLAAAPNGETVKPIRHKGEDIVVFDRVSYGTGELLTHRNVHVVWVAIGKDKNGISTAEYGLPQQLNTHHDTEIMMDELADASSRRTGIKTVYDRNRDLRPKARAQKVVSKKRTTASRKKQARRSGKKA